MSLTSVTPFELLQRKDKERRFNLQTSIEKKDLKQRSISYNFKRTISDQESIPEPEFKHANKDLNSRIAFNNSIKKSFFCRKILNKSIDSHLTSEEFQKVKEKFDRIEEKINDNKCSFFREIWENEHQKYYSQREGKEEDEYLEVVPRWKESDKDKPIPMDSSAEERKPTQQKKRKIEELGDIAEERKANLTFDLEILGNKKCLKAKDNNSSKSQPKRKNIKTAFNTLQDLEKASQMQPTTAEVLPKLLPQLQKTDSKKGCTFFKRFQQQNSTASADENEYFKISKIGHNIMDLYKLPIKNNEACPRLTFKRQTQQAATPTSTPASSYGRRDTKSSWSPSKPVQEARKYSKVETAEQKRVHLRRMKKPPMVQFTNDIKGWMVGQDNEEYLMQGEVFQQ